MSSTPTSLTSPGRSQHDVVIVGGGNGGISLAALLRREHPDLDVALVSPDVAHVYRPLLSYVGGGLAPLRRARRVQGDQIPPGVTWERAHATDITPDDDGMHVVTTGTGRQLSAADVVLCPGTAIDWAAIPGLWQACHHGHASTTYDPHLAPRTWDLLGSTRRGRAVFVATNRNTPCPAIGLKTLFLAVDYWTRIGARPDIDVTLVLEDDVPFGLAKVDALLADALDAAGVTVLSSTRADSIDNDLHVLHTRNTTTGARHDVEFDVMHITPPHTGHSWLTRTGLTHPDTTLVDTHPATLAHRTHPGIWAIGDAATLDTPSSGGGLRTQVPVVAHNITARRAGTPYTTYNGYTVAPIPLTRRHLLLAERDRYGHEQRTLPLISLAHPTMALLTFDLYLQPGIYWHRLLRGKGLNTP